MNKIKILLLFLVTASSIINAQQKTHPYIAVLDTNTVWNSVSAVEFGDWDLIESSIDYENDILNVNDTLYYKVGREGENLWCREDTLSKRIYARYGTCELIFYDFSLQVGDDIHIHNRWLDVDSIKTRTILGIDRDVFYFTIRNTSEHPIWIEGIGSLSDILRPDRTAYNVYTGWDDRELLCCKKNGELIYQSAFGETYGCQLEIDEDLPVLDYVYIPEDTVSLNESITIFIDAHDIPFSDTPLRVSATIKSPNGDTYLYDYLSNADQLGYPVLDYHQTVDDFYMQTGKWFISNIKITDWRYNVLDLSYNENNTPDSFYVKQAVGINNISKNKIQIFPNPVSNTLNVNLENQNISKHNYYCYITDITGKLILNEKITTNNFKIETTNFEKGFYFIQIRKNTKVILSEKIVKI